MLERLYLMVFTGGISEEIKLLLLLAVAVGVLLGMRFTRFLDRRKAHLRQQELIRSGSTAGQEIEKLLIKRYELLSEIHQWFIAFVQGHATNRPHKLAALPVNKRMELILAKAAAFGALNAESFVDQDRWRLVREFLQMMNDPALAEAAAQHEAAWGHEPGTGGEIRLVAERR